MKGEYTIYQVDKIGFWLPRFSWTNDFHYTWAYIVAKALSGDARYKIGGFYVEFENNQTPGGVSIPAVDQGDTIDYFNDLSGDKDFLRIPLLGIPTIDVNPGDESKFAEGQGNRLTYMGQTAGSVGILGNNFSEDDDSVVYGIAVVATPVWSDRSQDVILARSYYPSDRQEAKRDGSQVGISYQTTF